MKKYLLLFFLLPSLTLGATITLSAPDGTLSGVDCYIYSNSVSWTASGNLDGIRVRFDNTTPYDGSNSFNPGVTSNGEISFGATNSGSFTWSDFNADSLPHSNPDHVWSIDPHDASGGTYSQQLVTFVVNDTCSTGGGGSSMEEATSTLEQVQQNMLVLFFVFVAGSLLPFWIKM